MVVAAPVPGIVVEDDVTVVEVGGAVATVVEDAVVTVVGIVGARRVVAGGWTVTAGNCGVGGGGRTRT